MATGPQERPHGSPAGPGKDPMPLGVGIALRRAYRRMLGIDGSTVEEAARAAYTPTGPSVEEIEERIRKRRREYWGR